MAGKLNKGFTLIEVLVASIILFSSIAIVSLLYKGVLVSSQKAQQHIQLSAAVPFVIEVVQRDIRYQKKVSEQTLSGQGIYWGVDYQWRAKIIEAKAPPTNFDIESGKMVEHQAKYLLWQVSLKLEFKNVQQELVYNDLSWRDD